MIVTTLAPTTSDATELLEACISLLLHAGESDAIATLDMLHAGTIDTLSARRGTLSMQAVRECMEDALQAVSDYAATIDAALTVDTGDYVIARWI